MIGVLGWCSHHYGVVLRNRKSHCLTESFSFPQQVDEDEGEGEDKEEDEDDEEDDDEEEDKDDEEDEDEEESRRVSNASCPFATGRLSTTLTHARYYSSSFTPTSPYKGSSANFG